MSKAPDLILLEQLAAEQRNRLHYSVHELKSQVRDRLDVKSQARQHMLQVSAAVALFGLALGFSFAGLFSRR